MRILDDNNEPGERRLWMFKRHDPDGDRSILIFDLDIIEHHKWTTLDYGTALASLFYNAQAPKMGLDTKVYKLYLKSPRGAGTELHFPTAVWCTEPVASYAEDQLDEGTWAMYTMCMMRAYEEYRP